MEKKRSLKYLLVSVCFALLIASIGGMVIGATDNVEADATLAIKGATLDLNDKISIAYAVEASIAGYNAEDGSVANYVHIYKSNPNGTSALGEALEDYIIKNIGGVDYVLYITDGIAPTAYGENIYARLVDTVNGKYGAVRKAGVMELVGNLKANLKENDARYDVKNGLYNAILAYEEAAYKVVEGIESPFVSVSVIDGTYNDGNGDYESGIVRKGTEVTLNGSLDNSLNLASVNAYAAGWTVNGTIVQGNTATITADTEAFPSYGIKSDTDYNPYINTSSSSTNFATNWGIHLNDMLYANYGIHNGANFFAQLTSSGKTYTNWTKFTLAEDGTTQMTKYDWSKTADDGSVTAGGALYAPSFWYPTSNVIAGNSASIKVDVMIPTNDRDGDGIYNEAVSYTPASEEEDPETGDMLTIPESITAGDFFTSGGNNRLIHFDISLANKGPGFVNEDNTSNQGTNNPVNADIVVWAHLDAVVDSNKIVTGYKIRTNVGADGDQNSVTLPTVYALDEFVSLEFKLISDDTGLVTGYQLYANGTLVDQRLNNSVIKGKNLHIAGDNGLANACMTIIDLNRFQGDYAVKAMSFSANNFYTADEIVAMDNYDANYVAYSPIEVYDYERNVGDSINAIGYRWNELAALPGVGQFGNYALRVKGLTDASLGLGSWIYREIDNSIVVGKYGSSATGNFNVMADNPLYGAEDSFVEGQGVAVEFDFVIAPMDYNNNGSWNERQSGVGNDLVGWQNTMVLGYLKFGYSDSSNTTPNNGSFANIRVGVNGSTGAVLAFRPQANNDSNNNSCTNTHAGAVFHTRMELYPAADGVPEMLKLYVNGKLITTRYNVEDQATGFSFFGSTGAKDSLFDRSKIGFTWNWNSAKAYGSVIFRNVGVSLIDAQ